MAKSRNVACNCLNGFLWIVRSTFEKALNEPRSLTVKIYGESIRRGELYRAGLKRFAAGIGAAAMVLARSRWGISSKS